MSLRALGDLDLVAGLLDQGRDIDRRQRIGAMDLEKIAGRQRLQRLPRLQGRQGAFEAGKVKPGMGQR